MVSKNTRMSNVDLLRFLCSVFVIVEHFCEEDAINAFGMVESSGVFASLFIYRIIYSVARVAVPVFIVLSGYCSIYSKNAHFGKVIKIIATLIIFSLGKYLVGVLLGNDVLNFHAFLYALFPKSYFLLLYLVIYILSPYINTLVEQLSKRQYLGLLIIVFILFVVWSTFVNTIEGATGLKFDGGYTIGRTTTDMGFNACLFLTCYLFGGYIRKYKNQLLIKRWHCLIGIIMCVLITSIGKIYFVKFSSAFLYYDSIFVIIQSVLVVILFVIKDYRPSKILSLLGGVTLEIYLIHYYIMIIVVNKLNIELMISRGFIWSILAMVATISISYLCSLCCGIIYQLLTKHLFKWIETTKIGKFRFMTQQKINN